MVAVDSDIVDSIVFVDYSDAADCTGAVEAENDDS
jgi:hypothetical protein